jgi:hypothetical protein
MSLPLRWLKTLSCHWRLFQSDRTSQNLTFAIIPEQSHIAPLSHLRYDGEKDGSWEITMAEFLPISNDCYSRPLTTSTKSSQSVSPKQCSIQQQIIHLTRNSFHPHHHIIKKKNTNYYWADQTEERALLPSSLWASSKTVVNQIY